ncbi:hypothetical protein AVEN_200737-1 [Araneus ventricosus]|uniref:Uncharacterized protein n=1 Tax=Araneus ventricosus TaxID=182803 RepID=A0A4Y2SFF5_ARAVE|nr:hypothetical protein AVEN_272956-1 [Araneus ventricosus]GBN86861.1 hypothetical protein AVEN_222044-1 [Araneus ventricosus]GBN91225.1 hypothetical protein AVEN_73558-1 [Araneus ventricosus]GBN91226.1 hypothetical protein AVEN_200737-1 [Araneus ventricosus]
MTSKISKRNKFKCPIFGRPEDVSQINLPTNEYMLRCCFFEGLNLAPKTGNKEPTFSRIAVYVDYEEEETDCSSDISEVDLNLDTYKPSTSNRLISFTDPKYKQLTPFVSKSSQMRLGLPSTAVVGDRFGVSDRAVAAIVSSVLHHVGLITSNNSDLVVDNNKLRREKA